MSIPCDVAVAAQEILLVLIRTQINHFGDDLVDKAWRMARSMKKRAEQYENEVRESEEEMEQELGRLR